MGVHTPVKALREVADLWRMVAWVFLVLTAVGSAVIGSQVGMAWGFATFVGGLLPVASIAAVASLATGLSKSLPHLD